jgi:biopolymer transport protein ExbD
MDFMKFRKDACFIPGLNSVAIVPLINLGMLLLLFFITVSGYLEQASVKLDVFPSANAVYGETTGSVNEILIRGKGGIYLNGSAVRIGDITGRLSGFSPEGRILLIKASGDVPLSLLSQVWISSRKAGVNHINILTE